MVYGLAFFHSVDDEKSESFATEIYFHFSLLWLKIVRNKLRKQNSIHRTRLVIILTSLHLKFTRISVYNVNQPRGAGVTMSNLIGHDLEGEFRHSID